MSLWPRARYQQSRNQHKGLCNSAARYFHLCCDAEFLDSQMSGERWWVITPIMRVPQGPRSKEPEIPQLESTQYKFTVDYFSRREPQCQAPRTVFSSMLCLTTLSQCSEKHNTIFSKECALIRCMLSSAVQNNQLWFEKQTLEQLSIFISIHSLSIFLMWSST